MQLAREAAMKAVLDKNEVNKVNVEEMKKIVSIVVEKNMSKYI